MDLNRMIKRVTGDFKYLGISIVLGLSILLNIFAFFDIISMSGNFLSALSYVFTIIAEISLLIYALNFHGTRGPKTTLYAYFLLSVANTVLYAIINIFAGAIAFSSLFSVLINLLFPCLMLGFIFMGVKGMPVYALAFLECARRLILNIRGGIFLNVEGIIILLLVVNGIVLTFAIAHLISTDK